MFPLHWLHDPLADYLNAWYIIKVEADASILFYIIMFILNLAVAIGSGHGEPYKCDPVNTADCVFNDVYIGISEAWVSWVAWFIVHGLSYFTLFWFGADAVRVVRPQGGYDLYHLWANWLYELMVLTGAAPDYSNDLNYQTLQAEIYASKQKNKDLNAPASNGDDEQLDIEDTVLLAF
jgi:hypothetical protein